LGNSRDVEGPPRKKFEMGLKEEWVKGVKGVNLMRRGGAREKE